MKKILDKTSYLERMTVRNIWYSLAFLLFLMLLFFLRHINLDTFAISAGCIIGFILGFYALNWTQIKQVEKYRDIAEFLNISQNSNFEIKNKFSQNLIFPPDINNEDFEIVTLSRPLTYLGGDLHYQIKDEKGRYWFAIGDASGHDINSHLFSVMILTQINYYINSSETPREVNQKINEVLKERITKSKDPLPCYASLAILKSDDKGNIIHYGQHPNMIVFRKNTQDLEVIETSGDFIGTSIYPLQIDAIQEPKNFQLDSGDILFTFTDGIFEQKSQEGKYYGYKLYEFIKSYPKKDLTQFCEALFEDLREYTGNLITDDMTLMIIRKK
jgi:serine phosphatase RsbU (regulator of sigma subunit)